MPLVRRPPADLNADLHEELAYFGFEEYYRYLIVSNRLRPRARAVANAAHLSLIHI